MDNPDVTITDTSPTFFSGWRPLIGWISVLALATQFLGIPIIEVIGTLAGKTWVIPHMDMGSLVTLVTGVLGLGGMRTVEKLNDAQSKH